MFYTDHGQAYNLDNLLSEIKPVKKSEVAQKKCPNYNSGNGKFSRKPNGCRQYHPETAWRKAAKVNHVQEYSQKL